MKKFLCGLFRGHAMAPIKLWITQDTNNGRMFTITQQDCLKCDWSDRHWIRGVPK